MALVQATGSVHGDFRCSIQHDQRGAIRRRKRRRRLNVYSYRRVRGECCGWQLCGNRRTGYTYRAVDLDLGLAVGYGLLQTELEEFR